MVAVTPVPIVDYGSGNTAPVLNCPSGTVTVQTIADKLEEVIHRFEGWGLASVPAHAPPVVEVAAGSIPAGIITMWSGLITNIPSGWTLCDGSNGTPDLRSKFILGASLTTLPGTTGGNSTHAHASHSGVISHTHPVTDPGHAHVEQNNSATSGALAGWAARDTSTATPVATGYSTQSATTGVSTSAPAGAVSSISHDSVNHEPPYYALAYIMKS